MPGGISPNSILAVVAIISIAIFASLIYFFHLTLVEALSKVGFIILCLTILWAAFNRWVWKWKGVRSLHTIPDLNGRWVGHIDRENENDPHGFALEVRQTFAAVNCHTYSKNGASESLMAACVADNGGGPCQFIYTWLGSTKGALTAVGHRDGMFHGTTILRLAVDQTGKPRLSGNYFTDRYPRQTRGIIELSYVGPKCLNRYE